MGVTGFKTNTIRLYKTTCANTASRKFQSETLPKIEHLYSIHLNASDLSYSKMVKTHNVKLDISNQSGFSMTCVTD